MCHLTPRVNRRLCLMKWLLVLLFIAFSLSATMTEGLAQPPAPENLRTRTLQLPDEPFCYADPQLPAHFSEVADRFDNTPSDNPITDHGATLGRVLFYDVSLSANGKVSCASCHQQKLAFTDGVKFSTGFDGRKVRRNSMSLINLRYYRRGRFFWDERAASLEDQVLQPIENPIEMGHQLSALVRQLQRDAIYPPLFQAAFGTPEITSERIARALAQFVRSIVSFRSRYDVGRDSVETVYEPFPNFTDQENYGKLMFLTRGGCATCHLHDDRDETPPAPFDEFAEPDLQRQSAFFVVDRPVVNGIDADVEGVDIGVAEFSQRQQDRGAFRVSSLRNIAVTGPFMHDGRLPTIDSVLEHYNWSVKPHPNLDPRLADIAANGLALPEKEKVALAAFLETLTDHELLSDPKFSNPFAPANATE
ncbi:MAG: cytochrome c peroxidase [Fuerstiella sp.]